MICFIVNSLLVLVLFGGLLSLLAWGRRAFWLSSEACRAIAHVVMGLVCLTFPAFISATWQIFSLALMFTGILVLFRLKPGLLGGGAGLLHLSRRDSEGDVYFVGGITCALLLSRENLFVYYTSVLLLTFADAAAAVVGKWIGKKHCWGNAKTLEGSLAFCAVSILCILGSSAVMGCTIHVLLFGAICIIATVSEGLAARGSDNLWIPLACVVSLRISL